MKALVKARAERGLWMEDVPEPALGHDDVLIRVLRTGICGTDLHIFEWDPWAQHNIPVPLVVGHEFVGEIVEMGPEVHDLEVGDLVSGEGHLVCGRCRNCMAGRRVQCARTDSVGVNHPGAFAEYIAIPATNVWRHPKDIDLDVAAIFDPLGNAVHTALTFPVLGEDVLVTGAGPIGVMAALVAKHAGARHVVITDLSPFRLELARSVGVSKAIDPRQQSLTETMTELDMREGFDVGFEMSGQAAAMRSMLPVMCHGGKIAMLGLPTEDFGIDWGHFVLNMITLKGIYGREMFETWYWMSVFVQAGLDVSPVITHRYEAADFEKAFATMKAGECGKVILSWGES
ncbi:MAG TPA: L-threonine 3-dehydrogenase [Acidimicrobiales bacterium]|jgi:threonine 3-dehydrogenase|nr:L-threonine 3-dehydrogenase [Acidimicrobiales bacterium]